MTSYQPFADENPVVRNEPFSRVFESDVKVEIKPHFDKLANRQVAPHHATSEKKMIISRVFLSGFKREEFVISLVPFELSYADFDVLIDRLEDKCGKFRLLRLFFLMLIVCLLAGSTFLEIFLYNDFRDFQTHQTVLMWLGVGILVFGGLFFVLLIFVVLKYYEYTIKRDLMIENGRLVRKGLFWNVSDFAQQLTLEIKRNMPPQPR